MTEPALSQRPAPNLAQRLEEVLLKGDPESFLSEVAAHSDSAADSHWEVLAIVDQLYRRRKLSPQLFRLARLGIERRALGFHESAGARSDAPADRRATTQVQSQPRPQPQLQPQSQPQPQWQAAQAERELEQMRSELVRAQVEAVAQRQRAQQLEQLLGQQSQQQRPLAAPPRRQLHPAQPRHAPRQRRLWLIGAGGVLAALALVLVVMFSGVRRGAVAPSAVGATEAAADTAVPPVVAPAAAIAAPSGELTFETDRYVVNPAERQVVITVRRVAGSAGEVAVQWRAAGAGATAGRDFLVPAQTAVTLRDRQDTAQITIPILRNPARKHTEYFDLRLVRATGGAALGGQRRATVFLLPGAGGPRPPAAQRAGN